MLVAMVGGGWSAAALTATVTDSGGHTWVAGPIANNSANPGGMARISTCYLATAPGSITVTATFNSFGGGGGALLAVKVLTGAAITQTGAGSATQTRTSTSTAGTVSLTTTVAGSQVYGISDNPDNSTNTYGLNAATALAATTPVSSDYADATDGVRIIAWKAASVTGTPGATTFGGTYNPVGGRTSMVGLEILPDTGEDASRPPVITLTGAGTVTTASFSPPTNTLLLALVSGGYGATNPTGVTITDSGSHTWTAAATATGTATNKGVAKIYHCYLSTAPGSITVTATFTNLSGGRLLDVHVITGAASNQSTGTAATSVRSTAVTAADIAVALTKTGSRVYGISDDPDTASAFTANGLTTVLTNYNNTTDGVQLVSWRGTNSTGSLDVGTSPTYGGSWATGQTSNTAAFEVLPVDTSTTYAGAATLTGTATLSGTGALTVTAATTLAGTASLSAVAAQTELAAATLASTASLTATGVREQPAAAALAGTASLASAAALTVGAAAILPATSDLTAAAFLIEPAAVTWAGVTTLTAVGTRVQPGAVSFTGIATLTAAGVAGAGATLVAVGSLAPSPFQTLAAALAMTGTATFTGPAWVTERVTVTMAGVAVLAPNLSIPASATLAATSALNVTAVTVFTGAALLAGTGILGPTAKVVAAAVVTLPGVATLAATAFRIAGGIGVLFAVAATLRAGAVGTTPGQVLSVTFWALNNDGTYNVALPDLASWQLSLVESSPGAVTLDYPADGRNFDVLRNSVTADRDLLVAIWIGGKDPGSLRAILNTAEGDDVAESAVWRFSGNFLNVRMEEATIAPRTSVVTPPTGPAPTEDLAALRVYAATAGTIMATLMQEAQARGTLSDITYIFTNTVDSHGVPWSKTITLKIAPGTDYLAVLAALGESSLCEWEIVDHELVLWEFGTRGTDYTATTPPIILRAGDTLTDSPRKHTVRNAGTTLTVAGGEGLYTTVSDATALARRGRRIEQYISQGSLTDAGSLSAYATAKLPSITAGAMEVGGGIALTGIGPEPLIAYRNGDWIWSDTGLGLERLRIKQLTVSCDSNGILTAGLSLNDLIADQLEALAQRMAGIEGGTTITGTSNASPAAPYAPDTMAPAAPQGLIVTSLAQPSPDPVPRSAVFASWAAVVTNADTTAIGDLAGYTVQWRYLTPPLTTDWNQLAAVTTASASWSGVIAGQSIEVRVLAFDTSNNQSNWSTSAVHTTQTDATPPPTPSTPLVTEFLGTLTVTWDGLGSAGEAMPTDFAGIQIHRSTTTGFTPGPTTFIENMLGPGSRNYPDLPLGVTQYFRLISYDRTGNLSAASAQASAVPTPIGMGDIAFTDPGNLVEDGSFEVSTSRTTHAARSDAAWSFVSGGADHGSWFVRGSGATGSGLRALVLSPLIPTTPGSDYAIRWAMRATGVNGDMSMRIRWTLVGTTTDTISTFTPGFSAAWLNTEVGNGVFTAPAGAVSMQIIVMLHANCTAGTWDLDRIEARETIGTLLVRNLAVTDAQIASASVGKLTAGTITAVMLMAGLLRSGTTGLRYELDANGLRFYDASNNLAIDLNRAAGTATITGTLQTGITGRRIVVSGPSNEIRFYPVADETRYARMYSFVSGSSDIEVDIASILGAGGTRVARIGILPGTIFMSNDPSPNDGSIWSRSLIDTQGVYLGRYSGTATTFPIYPTTSGGFIELKNDSAHMGWQNASGTRGYIDIFQGTFRLYGQFTNSAFMYSDEALFMGEQSIGAANSSLAISYGPTMNSYLAPVASIDSPIVQGCGITNNSLTGFTVRWPSTGSGTNYIRWVALRF